MLALSLPDGAKRIEEEEGIDALEQVQRHEDKFLYERANSLIDRFFYGEEEELNESEESIEYPSWRKPQTFSEK